MRGKRDTLGKGSAMMFLSLSAAALATAFISVAIARFVNVEEFGEYSIVISMQTFVVVLAGFSIGTALSKLVAEYNVRDLQMALRLSKMGIVLVFLFSSLSCLIYFGLSDVIGELLYGKSSIAHLIPFSALAVFGSSLFSAAFGIVQGCQRMRLLSLMQVAAPISTLTLVLALLPFIGVEAVFVSTFVAQSLVAILALGRLDSSGFPVLTVSISKRIDYLARILLSFSIPAVLSASMGGPVVWLGNTILAISVDWQAVGYFAVASIFFQALTIIPQSIVIPLVPRISEAEVHSRQKMEGIVVGSVAWASAVLFAVMFGVAVFSEPLVSVVFGSSYSSSSALVYIMSSSSYLYSVTALMSAFIIGTGRMWLSFKVSALWASVFVVLVLLLVPQYGAPALAVSFVASYGAYLLVFFYVSSRLLERDMKSIYLTIAVAIAFFLTGYLVLYDLQLQTPLYELLLFMSGVLVVVYSWWGRIHSTLFQKVAQGP